MGDFGFINNPERNILTFRWSTNHYYKYLFSMQFYTTNFLCLVLFSIITAGELVEGKSILIRILHLLRGEGGIIIQYCYDVSS